MRLTIIPSDGAVYKDELSYSGLTLTGIPENVHALQWNETAGWIEFKNESEFRRSPNQVIQTLPDWAIDALTAWDAADAATKAQPVVTGVQTL